MRKVLEEIAEKLTVLNEENATSDSFRYLSAADFPEEYECLVTAVNQSIEVGEVRSRQERNNLEMINDMIRSGMWSMEFDAAGRMIKVTWSQAFRDMIGFSGLWDFPDRLESWSDRLHPEDQAQTLAAYWAAIAGKQRYDVEYRMLTKTEGYKWFRATGEVARREDGTPSRYIGTFVDITQKKENERLTMEKLAAQEELEQAKNHLQNQNDVLRILCSDFLAVYRMDLKTGQCKKYEIAENERSQVADVVKFEEGYSAGMERYIKLYVASEDIDYVRTMTKREHVAKELQTQKSYVIRYRVRENQQGVEHFEVHFAVVDRAGGEGSVLIGFRNIDLVVRKEKEYKLQTQQDIEETLEGSRTGIWTLECEEGCAPRLYADKTMRMLLGVEGGASAQLCYQQWMSCIDEAYQETVWEGLQEMKRGCSEVIYPWKHPQLGQIYVRTGGVPDEKYDKAGYRLKGYHQDVTETMVARERQEKELFEALAEARQANRAKTEFLSHMSHDIRTPINGILGMLAISDKSADNPRRQKECREKIRTAAEHLLSLINDVLDISKVESGAVVFEKESFDIEELIEDCVEILRSQAQEKSVVLEQKCRNIRHTSLIGSPLHLRQILINIMSNAVKYNRPGGKVSVCAGELQEENGCVLYRFTIEDTGVGMSEEFQKRLFEPFTQESNDARTHYKGSGLGMAIARNLTEQMGGSISVVSEIGKGSTFTVTLPLEVDAKESRIRRNPDAPEEEGMADISGMHVLLVEDNELNSEVARYMLESAGATMVAAVNGKEAVDIFSASRPWEFDCILMDVMMPVMNGLEAARAIRGMDRADAGDIPIIALSANVFAEDVRKTAEAGMNRHLAKPLDAREVFGAMAEYKKE